MQKKILIQGLFALAFVVGAVSVSVNADAQKPAQVGPPDWVIEA